MQKRNTLRVATVVGLILLIPLFGNIFIDGWNWGVLDFIVMGALLFGTGLALDFAVRKIQKPIYRIGACVAIVLAFLCIWVELAVDGVSQALALFF